MPDPEQLPAGAISDDHLADADPAPREEGNARCEKYEWKETPVTSEESGKTDQQIEQEARDVAKEVVGLTWGLAELYINHVNYDEERDADHLFGAALARALGSTDFLEEPVHEDKLGELMIAAADAYRALSNRIEDARDTERYRRMS